MHHAGQATRSFEQEANNSDSMLAKYPADFTLFEIGLFDDQTGELAAHEQKVNLGMASAFKRAPQEQGELLNRIRPDMHKNALNAGVRSN